MKIARIIKNSAAAVAGIREGDDLLAVDESIVRDWLDYQFLASDARHTLSLRRGDQEFDVELTREWGGEFGLTLQEEKIRCCGNHCTFCFIDQNPKGLRPTLYVKDEDYRLSLLFGNYITLTNLADWEIERIIEQKLSPLYISIHASDPSVRRRLIRSRDTDDIMPRMKHLTNSGINMHIQIVLVPGYNDGAVLTQTIDELISLHPQVETIAVVPVGLTSHRGGLTELRELTSAESRELIDTLEAQQQSCLNRFGHRILFLADEFYLLAGKEIPPAASYEDFPQIENGVGLIRRFESNLDETATLFGPSDSGASITADQGRKSGETVVLATGRLFAPLLESFLSKALLRTGERERFEVSTLAVKNCLFGESVTVAGLLSGADIIAAVKHHGVPDRLVVSPEIFNTEGFTLDHLRPIEIVEQLQCSLQIGFGDDIYTNSN